MGVRYSSSFYSLDNVQWKIDILDSLYSGSVNLFRSGPDGFSLSYKGGESRFTPLITSECRFTIMLESLVMENFISDLQTDTGGRFQVALYKNSVFHWAGNMVVDLVSRADEGYPTAVQLSATDGLGKLKDLRYDDDGVPYTGREALLTHIRKILLKIGTDSFWGSSDIFIKTAVHWYERMMVRGNEYCPLKVTNVDNDCFLEYASSEQYMLNLPLIYSETTLKGKDCNTVLKIILSLMDCRIVLSEGKWWVLQVPHLAELNIYTRSYSKTEAFLSYNTAENHKCTESYYERGKGGTTDLLPALRRVERKYSWRYSKYGSSLIPPTITNASWYNCGEVFEGNLVTKGTIKQAYIAWGSPIGYSDWFKLHVKLEKPGLATYYLQQVGDYFYWSTSISFVTLKSEYHLGGRWEENFDINVKCPPVPATYPQDNQVSWKMEYWKSVDENNNVVAFPAGTTHTYEYTDFVFQMEGYEGGSIVYYSNNLKPNVTPPEYVDNMDVEVLPEAWMGDLGTKYPYPGVLPGCGIGRLKIMRADAQWVYSAEWAVGNLTDWLNINQLAVVQALNGQKVPCERFQGTIISTTYAAWKILGWSSYRYLVPSELNFTAALDEWTGVWFNIRSMTGGGVPGGGGTGQDGMGVFNQSAVWDDTNVWNSGAQLIGGNLTGEEDQGVRAPRSNLYAGLKAALRAKEFALSMVNTLKITTTSAEIASGSKVSIDINSIGHAMLIKGDVVHILDVNTWTFHQVVINSTQASGSIYLDIESHDFPEAIPSGAIIIYDMLSLAKKVIV